jgi:hypothetical protein
LPRRNVDEIDNLEQDDELDASPDALEGPGDDEEVLDDEDLNEDLEELGPESLVEEEEEEEEEEDEDAHEEESLDELLTQRSSPSRRSADDAADDADILAFAPDRDDTITQELRTRIVPIKDRQEFVCKRCHLVKARSQLADAGRQLCRDCV